MKKFLRVGKQELTLIMLLKKRKQTCLKKYGVENPFQNKELIKIGVQKKYGVYNYFQCIDLLKQAYINKFGVDNPQKDSAIKQKTLKTVKQKYGELIGAVPAAQTKTTNLERYGNKYFFGSDVGRMTYENLKNNYEWTDEQIEELRRQKIFNGSKVVGRASKESLTYFIPLYKKLRKLGFNRKDIYIGLGKNKEKYINGFLYDFCLESTKIIIEFHGEKFHPNPTKLTKKEWNFWRCLFSGKTADECFKYTQQKLQCAKSQGYEIAEIWSNNTKEENWTIINNIFKQKGIIL